MNGRNMVRLMQDGDFFGIKQYHWHERMYSRRYQTCPRRGFCEVEMLATSVMAIRMMTEELARKYQCNNLEFELKYVVQSVMTEIFGSQYYASPPPASTVSGFANVIAEGSKVNGVSSVLWRKESKSKFSNTSPLIKSELLISYVFCCQNQHQMLF